MTSEQKDIAAMNADAERMVSDCANPNARRVGLFLLAAMTCFFSQAQGADGDPDQHFGNVLPGRSRVQFGSSASRQIAYAAATQPDGKLLLAGAVVLPEGVAIGVARLTDNGQLDASFAGTGSRSISLPNTTLQGNGIAVQTDGKIVIAATITVSNGNPDFLILRLNADGSTDTTFNGTGMHAIAFDLGGINADFASTIAIQPDGKIVVGGEAYRPGALPNPPARMSFARLNRDGSLDPSFGFGGKSVFDGFDNGSMGAATAIVSRVLVQPDGKIVAIGTAFWQAGNEAYYAAMRMNSDGSPDASFGAAGGFVAFGIGTSTYQWANGAALQTDGKVILVGSALGDYAIVRLNANGSIDTAFGGGGAQIVGFDYGGNLDDTATDVVVQSDGRIVIGGRSDIDSRTSANAGDMSATRLLPNGALDTSFGSGGKLHIGFDLGNNGFDFANAMVLQAGKPVLVGGAEVDPSPGDSEPFVFAAARLDNDLIFSDHFDP